MPKRGDIVLVTFPFTDLTGEKQRPALVIARSADHCVTLFITSRTRGDKRWLVRVDATKSNGLLVPSVIRCDKIASFDMRIIHGRIGRASDAAMREISSKLRRLLSL
jgi:mRNA interferase MazF